MILHSFLISLIASKIYSIILDFLFSCNFLGIKKLRKLFLDKKTPPKVAYFFKCLLQGEFIKLIIALFTFQGSFHVIDRNFINTYKIFI